MHRNWLNQCECIAFCSCESSVTSFEILIVTLISDETVNELSNNEPCKNTMLKCHTILAISTNWFTLRVQKLKECKKSK